ncbi:class I SAM-dependent methyltransferase [Cohnella caldifontis]|uniref:class I SAM-dependent methyltransferase n=1 Tax=Cohnella caldifontis TaxID=3027471 RepID=UPI0023EB98D2|nr:class I SAM-dependent methyltransferase [Cohnella sp. YIM B05605]
MNEIFGGKEIVIFGTGFLAKKITGIILFLDGKISGYIDNNSAKWGSEFFGQIVSSPDSIVENNIKNKIIIVGSSFYSDISGQLISMGLIENSDFFGEEAFFDRIYDYHAQKEELKEKITPAIQKESRYIRPQDIHAEMGGTDEVLDQRLTDVIDLISDFELNSLNNFLDIGMGRGQLAKWLANKGKKVTGTGIHIDSYQVEVDNFKTEFGIDVVECSVESMPFGEASFDAVIMSHILEHCPNVGLALQEVRRVLKDDGVLFLFVPPPEQIVCSGHVSVGWNVGQLIYVLLLNGFDVKTGSFARYNYNVCAIVKKRLTPIPPLRGDYGDLHILNQHDLLPLPIVTPNGINNSFWGDIESINWPGIRFNQKIRYLRGYIPGQ